MKTSTKVLAALLGGGVLIFTGVRMKNIDLSARVTWGEARNQGIAGMQAVLNVMRNRMLDPRYPSSLAAVATQKWQFSAYNESDPNRAQLDAVTDDDAEFAQAVELAARAVQGTLPDITGGATHYHHTSLPAPYWTAGAEVTTVLGDHIFYRGVA
jgi:spore germination cell wall hydrolase CwlJ-like protein